MTFPSSLLYVFSFYFYIAPLSSVHPPLDNQFGFLTFHKMKTWDKSAPEYKLFDTFIVSAYLFLHIGSVTDLSLEIIAASDRRVPPA